MCQTLPKKKKKKGGKEEYRINEVLPKKFRKSLIVGEGGEGIDRAYQVLSLKGKGGRIVCTSLNRQCYDAERRGRIKGAHAERKKRKRSWLLKNKSKSVVFTDDLSPDKRRREKKKKKEQDADYFHPSC